MDDLTIGELSRRTGVAASALRYYEDLGILEPSHRVSGRRRYDEASVALVGVILLLREVGFTLEEIQRMVTPRSTARHAWRELASRKLVELDGRIVKTKVAKAALEHMLACPHENVLECPNFWKVVGGLLAGRPLADAHSD